MSSFKARAVIDAASAHVPKRVQTYARRDGITVRFDQDFDAIVDGCVRGRITWITPGLRALYRQLYQLGYVSCVGTYRDGRLIGGLWGLVIGGTFGLMSMFHEEDHAGAVAFAALVSSIKTGERWSLLDVGCLNANYARYGAWELPLAEFVALVLQNAVPPVRPSAEHRRGNAANGHCLQATAAEFNAAPG